MNTINPDRLDWLNGLHLASGGHDEAAIKEAASVAGAVEKLPPRKWGSTNKGLKSFVAEHIIVTDEKLYLTRDGVPLTEPDGIDRGIVHTFRGSGFRANEYVENVTIAATVITDYDFSTKEWAMLWLTGQEQGIGANRSQGSGRYTVTSWEKI